MEEVKITILGNPLSVNQTYKTCRGSRLMYLSERATVYARSVRLQARGQWHGRPISEDLEVTYFYFFSDRKRRDHLNFNKLLNDHLNQIVWRDDQQIKISHHYTEYDKKNPRVEIIIKILAGRQEKEVYRKKAEGQPTGFKIKMAPGAWELPSLQGDGVKA